MANLKYVWWCASCCVKKVLPIEVTFDEVHDPRKERLRKQGREFENTQQSSRQEERDASTQLQLAVGTLPPETWARKSFDAISKK